MSEVELSALRRKVFALVEDSVKKPGGAGGDSHSEQHDNY